MVKIGVFHTFSKEKYRDSRKQGDFDPYFSYDSLIIIWGKMRVFKVLEGNQRLSFIMGPE